MRSLRTFSPFVVIAHAFFLLVVLSGWASPVSAEPIRLKNGMTLRGRKLIMTSLGSQPVGMNAVKAVANGPIKNYCITRVENDWQIVFFPIDLQEVLDETQITSLSGFEPVVFQPDKPVYKKTEGKLAALGTISYADDFDAHGRRRVTIELGHKSLDVTQAITHIAPDHVLIDSLNIDWKMGLGLKSIPFETIEKIIRKLVKPDDFRQRTAIALFMAQAEYYEYAFKELDAIEKEFSAEAKAVATLRTNFMNSFGSDILRRLQKRKRAGQHILAESYARILVNQPINGTVKKEVQVYLDAYDAARQSIERAKHLLSDWQSKLEDVNQQEKLQPLRDEVVEQLDFETLPRLDAFLKAEADAEYGPAERLGLAYTGWLLGAAYAEPDLEQAFRLWDARHVVLEYLRSDGASELYTLTRRLEGMENVGPERILNMVAQLPPILDSSDLTPGEPYEITSPANNPVKYWVVLPAEYSPHHDYPMVVALRSRTLTAQQTSMVWAGDKTRPDLGSQRGYIVIAPEYADQAQQEHTYGSPAHSYVLDCIDDARKRFSVDSDRVFLTGHGMGADAAFDIGMAHADQFAGVLPSGGGAVPTGNGGPHYCNFYWENGIHTHWYVVGKGFHNGQRDKKSDRVFDDIMKKGVNGRYDFVLVEYVGRNGDDLYDELPKSYDWMDLASHVRVPQPRDFKMKALRKADNRFFWLTANGLPRDYILPSPPGNAPGVKVMEIHGKITPGNTILLSGLTENYTLRLSPDLIDFNKKVVVKIGSKEKYAKFLTPEVKVILDELRRTGDRKRLPLAVLSP